MKKSTETKAADDMRVTADQQTPQPIAVTSDDHEMWGGKVYNPLVRTRRVSDIVTIAAALCSGMISNGQSIGELRNKADGIATTAAAIAQACDSKII